MLVNINWWFFNHNVAVVNKELIKSVLSILLNIIGVACLVTIIIITSLNDSENYKNDHHLLIMFILICAAIAKMYLCLPTSFSSNNYYRRYCCIVEVVLSWKYFLFQAIWIKNSWNYCCWATECCCWGETGSEHIFIKWEWDLWCSCQPLESWSPCYGSILWIYCTIYAKVNSMN